jgi:hypothetical protein
MNDAEASQEDSLIQSANLQSACKNSNPHFSFNREPLSIQQDGLYKTTKVIVIKHNMEELPKQHPVKHSTTCCRQEECHHCESPVFQVPLTHQNRSKDTKLQQKAMMEIDSMSMEEDKDQIIVMPFYFAFFPY